MGTRGRTERFSGWVSASAPEGDRNGGWSRSEQRVVLADGGTAPDGGAFEESPESVPSASKLVGLLLGVGCLLMLGVVAVWGVGTTGVDDARTAAFDVTYADDYGGPAPDTVTITHVGGHSLDPARLRVRVGDETAYDGVSVVNGYGSGDPATAGWTTNADGAVEAGDRLVLSNRSGLQPGATVTVALLGRDGDDRSTLAQFSVPASPRSGS